MRWISLTEASELTSKAWRTCKRRAQEAGLEPNGEDLYPSDKLLEVIYATGGESDSLDLQAERARLAKWQADKTEQEVEVRAGDLLPREEVIGWVSNMIVTVKTRLVQIPNAVGQLIDQKYAPTVIAEIKRLINEALEELTAERPSTRRANAEVGAADGSDGESVGGREPPAVKRKQRSSRALEN